MPPNPSIVDNADNEWRCSIDDDVDDNSDDDADADVEHGFDEADDVDVVDLCTTARSVVDPAAKV